MPRIAFSGRFQADVSTVNNDVRHYANADFEPRFQEMMKSTPAGTVMNGWWNPRGTGAFRLVDVTVKQSVLKPGDAGKTDPATGLYLNAQASRTAAKLVDFDPQFQMGSAIWGLRVVLTDGETEYMRGDYLAAPFRDLFFGRVVNQGGSGGASAKFTSVLESVEWTGAADASPVLSALKAASTANDDRLSVNFMTFGYIGSASNPAFTYGHLAGAIGTFAKTDPKRFVLGRRFAPVTTSSPFANASGIGFFDADVGPATVSLDLSNALPLTGAPGPDGGLNAYSQADLGELRLVAFRKPDRNENGQFIPVAREEATVSDQDLVEIGGIPYQDTDWLMETAGIVDFELPPGATADTDGKRLIDTVPLALVTPTHTPGLNIVRIRETNLGMFVRADDMELRVDTYAGKATAETVTFHAACYGVPAGGVDIDLGLQPPQAGQGGSGGGTVDPPKAAIPVIGTPKGAVHFKTRKITTLADGTAALDLAFSPPGNPRDYIDGQIYKINYTLDMPSPSAMPMLDQVVVHVRDAYNVPAAPAWEADIKPVLQQFGNLYPIMSHGLFSFADEAVVREHARIMAFALIQPIEDPNHMPVTRDLSAPKREAILKWLAGFLDKEEASSLGISSRSSGPLRAVAPAEMLSDAPAELVSPALAIPASVATGSDGKTQAVRDELKARRGEQGETE